jgi:hypothetical protein
MHSFLSGPAPDNQYRSPELVALTRDVLLVFTIGAGVERVLNTAHNICHYRRGRFTGLTI